jgi:hypothetical protein
MRTVEERTRWQMTELQFFVKEVLSQCPRLLMQEPVQRASGHYDEAPKREKTQGEMVDIMARELANLPRFTAFAKVIEEQDGVQTVRKCKIVTQPLPRVPARPLTSAMVERWTIAAGLCVPRRRIEQELQARQEKWLRRPGQPKPPPGPHAPPPASEPPPTSEPPPAAA